MTAMSWETGAWFDVPTLRAVLDDITYRDGWTFSLVSRGGPGLLLKIDARVIDPVSMEALLVSHQIPVPPSWGRGYREWAAWVFDMVVLVEMHEAGEFFKVGEQRPFVPEHGPGADPYARREVWA